MTTAFHKICRICSSPAHYEIFAKIPTYLHSTANELQNWQKPINVLLEETTGLKVSRDDALPHLMCAICISYLKHAATFREQAINNSLTLKAVQMISEGQRQQQQQQQLNVPPTNKRNDDKASDLITAQDLQYTDERQLDANILVNNMQSQEQDKVYKQLINNSNYRAREPPTLKYIEQQMRYLNLLFDKDTNAHCATKRRNNCMTGTMSNNNHRQTLLPSGGSGGDCEEEFGATTTTSTASSDNEEEADTATGGGDNNKQQKFSSMFTYQEKNFEEDDILELDELRNAITINIPESCCKERKCRACYRRFMFEESYDEHTSNCIEYQLLTFIEEANRFIDIRRNKAISPHEFVRRMIFAMRKTCEWLKANSCDIPDFDDTAQRASVQTQTTTRNEKYPLAANPLMEEILPTQRLSVKDRFFQLDKENIANNISPQNIKTDNYSTADKPFLTSMNSPDKEPLAELLLNTFIDRESASKLYEESNEMLRTDNCRTPITVNNNILYEIERSQSRNKHCEPLNVNVDYDETADVKKPIAILATSHMTTTTTTTTKATLQFDKEEKKHFENADDEGDDNNRHPSIMAFEPVNNERIMFLQKLHKATTASGCHPPPSPGGFASHETTTPSRIMNTKNVTTLPQTPLIQVRKDLHIASSKPATPICVSTTSSTFSARCNPCQIIFETLAALEMHNAQQHNSQKQQKTVAATAEEDEEQWMVDEQRKRIIAMFEDEEDI